MKRERAAMRGFFPQNKTGPAFPAAEKQGRTYLFMQVLHRGLRSGPPDPTGPSVREFSAEYSQAAQITVDGYNTVNQHINADHQAKEPAAECHADQYENTQDEFSRGHNYRY